MNFFKRFLALVLTVVLAVSLVPGVYGKESMQTEEPVEHTHTYWGHIIKKASCSEKGLARYSCSCGDSYEVELDSPEHEYVSEIVKEATCAETGIIRYTCSCGDSYDIEIESPEHKYIPAVIRDATCAETGIVRYTCSCGESYDVVIPSPEHEYISEVIKDVTCTENGIIRYTCSCGDFFDEDIIASGHNYTSKVIKKAACTENGIRRYTCSCGDFYDETIKSKGGHKYNVVEHTEPTQEADGITVYVCSVCKDTYTETKEHENKFVATMYLCAKRQVSPLGHMWIYIKNNDNEPIEVGAYTVPVGQGVSVGTFGLTRADGIGIYYNVEAYTVNKYGIDRVICMQENLTAEQLEKVSKKIRNNNLWDPIIFNCTGMAFAIWNAGSSTTLVSFVLPVFGRLAMLTHDHTDKIEMYYPTEDQVFKQKGSRKNARLEVVSASSISHGI